MLEARTVVLVGASERPGSLGARMVAEVARSPARPSVYLVNPRYESVDGARCYPSISDVPEPADVVLLAVQDRVLPEQLAAAAEAGARSAVIFGTALDVRERLTEVAVNAGMAVCGAGCMGFVNVAYGLRAIGYIEPDPLLAGPVALVTQSGSVFSALLRARRGFGFTLAVSSGQELVTPAAAYGRYALSLPGTRILALVLEAIRGELPRLLAQAAAADVPVVLLTAGASAVGRDLVAAHSGALAAGDGAWEALAAAYGVHRVHDLAELADTLELFAAGRRCPPGTGRSRAQGAGRDVLPRADRGSRPRADRGIATVHDSGLERAHVADLAADLGVPFARIGPHTRQRLTAVLDPGLEPGNPLDVWGTGRDTEALFTECLSAMAADPAVSAVVLAVDLVPEFDGDDSYPAAVLATASGTDKPVAVLAGIPAAIDPAAAARLRAAGVPVLEGTRTGLLALRHLLDHGPVPARPDYRVATSSARQDRWGSALSGDPPSITIFELLHDYDIPVVRMSASATREQTLTAAAAIGYPVVLKTGEPGIAHKSDVGGVIAGLADPVALERAYHDLAARLGPRALVCETAAPGVELLLGIARDHALGPLIVLGAGGIYTELLSERAVLLPPVTPAAAEAALHGLRVAKLLAGARGQRPADLGAVVSAIVAVSDIACELSGALAALDINPLICGPAGVVAVDALAVLRDGHDETWSGQAGPGR
jgi:acetate---CoA ligase (ADP-forming)